MNFCRSDRLARYFEITKLYRSLWTGMAVSVLNYISNLQLEQIDTLIIVKIRQLFVMQIMSLYLSRSWLQRELLYHRLDSYISGIVTHSCTSPPPRINSPVRTLLAALPHRYVVVAGHPSPAVVCRCSLS